MFGINKNLSVIHTAWTQAPASPFDSQNQLTQEDRTAKMAELLRQRRQQSSSVSPKSAE